MPTGPLPAPAGPGSRAARRRAPAAATALALALALVGVLGPRSGTDLASALEHESFAAHHGLTPVDLSTYSGSVQFGYSLLAQYVGALLGARLAGALATVGSAYLLARLLRGTRRPLLGALAGAACLAGDVVTGRTAFALGLAAGLGAALAVQQRRTVAAGGLALLAGALSPLAGLFAGVAGAALLLSGRRRDGLAVGVGAAVPVAVTGLVFGQGGDALISAGDVVTGSVLALAVAVAAPRGPLRAGAWLQVLGLLAALVAVPSIGHNADRLVVLLAAPLVLALAPWRPAVVGAVALALVVLRPPWSPGDLARAGDPALSPAFAAPVVAELQRRAPTGRVEAVPLREHGEVPALTPVVPLARGWLRQLDTAQAPLFYDGRLDAARYRAFLDARAVQYVALADTALDGAGVAEAALVRGGLPYLSPVWRGGAWTLYAVADPTPLADGAQVLRSTPAALVLQVAAPGTVLVRVLPSRWLTLSGPGCLEPAGGAVRLQARRAGEYVLSSALQLRASAAC